MILCYNAMQEAVFPWKAYLLKEEQSVAKLKWGKNVNRGMHSRIIRQSKHGTKGLHPTLNYSVSSISIRIQKSKSSFPFQV